MCLFSHKQPEDSLTPVIDEPLTEPEGAEEVLTPTVAEHQPQSGEVVRPEDTPTPAMDEPPAESHKFVQLDDILTPTIDKALAEPEEVVQTEESLAAVMDEQLELQPNNAIVREGEVVFLKL